MASRDIHQTTCTLQTHCNELSTFRTLAVQAYVRASLSLSVSLSLSLTRDVRAAATTSCEDAGGPLPPGLRRRLRLRGLRARAARPALRAAGPQTWEKPRGGRSEPGFPALSFSLSTLALQRTPLHSQCTFSPPLDTRTSQSQTCSQSVRLGKATRGSVYKGSHKCPFSHRIRAQT